MGLLDWLFGKKPTAPQTAPERPPAPSPPEPQQITPPSDPVEDEPAPPPPEPEPEPMVPGWKVAQEANRAALARYFDDPSSRDVQPEPEVSPSAEIATVEPERPKFLTTSLAEANAKFARENPDRGWEPPQPPLPRGRFATDRHHPEGKWVKATLVSQVEGIQHRRANAEAFASAAHKAEQRRQPYGLRLELDPTNPFDPNAIKVFGEANGREWHIGYVDRHTAADVASDLVERAVPFDAELYAIHISSTGFIEIKMIVLAPPGNSHKTLMNRRKAEKHDP